MLITLVTWAILIGILLWVGRWITKQWEARQQAATQTAAGQEAPTVAANALHKRLSTIQAKLFGTKQPAIAAKFRLWLAAAIGTEPALHHWLMALSDEQLDALAMHLERFTHEMGFELSWLLNQEVAQYPSLARALTTVVLDYCRACHHAVGLQEELEVYKALRSYVQNPNSAQNREFGQALFGKLLEQGLTSIKVADHLALPELQRRQQILETIIQVAMEKQLVLQRIVQEMLTQSSGTATNTPAAVLNGVAKQATP